MELQSVIAAKRKIAAIAPVQAPTSAGSANAASAAAAFTALMQSIGFKFSSDTGLNHVEGQFIRVRPASEQKADAKPREAIERPKADRPEPEATKENDDTTSARKADAESAEQDDSDADATSSVSPTAGQTAVDEQGEVAAAAIQFEILVQLPTGEADSVVVVDLETLLGVAEQNPEFAKALQQAFGASLDAGNQGVSLEGLDTGPADPTLLTAAAIGTDTAALSQEATDQNDLTRVFRGLIDALRPATTQTKTNENANAKVSAEAIAETDGSAAEAIDLRSANAIQQSKDLARALGGESKIEIKVVVQGQPVARTGFDWNPYNHYAGYNPADLRVDSLANGQSGTGLGQSLESPEAEVKPEVRLATPWAAPAAMGLAAFDPSANSGTRASGAATAVRADGAGSSAIERPAQAQQSPNQQSNNSFNGLLNQGAATTTASKAAPTERPKPTTPQEVIEQIKVNITRAAKAGVDRVTIQLKPEDLGRIEVKLEMSHDGKVKAMIAAENPATLELLRSDARGMERALQDAGLRASAEDLEFSLRGQDSEKAGRDGSPGSDRGRGLDRDATADDVEVADDPTLFDYAQAARQRGGVDTYA